MYALDDYTQSEALEDGYVDHKAWRNAQKQYPKVLDPQGKRQDPKGKRYYIKNIDKVGALTTIKNLFKEEITKSIKTSK